jgi:hypothetical protein
MSCLFRVLILAYLFHSLVSSGFLGDVEYNSTLYNFDLDFGLILEEAGYLRDNTDYVAIWTNEVSLTHCYSRPSILLPRFDDPRAVRDSVFIVLMMEAASTSETSVNFYQTTRRIKT